MIIVRDRLSSLPVPQPAIGLLPTSGRHAWILDAPCMGFNVSSDCCERLIQIGEQVANVLQTERKPHHVLPHTRSGQLRS